MSSAQALFTVWNDFKLIFENTSYAFFYIEANIICIIILAILFSRQMTASIQNDTQIAYSRALFVQILYCISGIPRVLADIGIIPKTDTAQYIIIAVNFGLFSCMCWLMFIYIEYYQGSKIFSSIRNKIIIALPFLFNILMLVLNPVTKFFIEYQGDKTNHGLLYYIMIAINLLYLAAAAFFTYLRRQKMGRYDRENLLMMSLLPFFFLIFVPIQSLNWKIPFLCYAIVISNIVIYINHADSLVSIDPLTKIANRNGLITNLSERLWEGQKTPEGLEKLEMLYLFVLDIEDLGSINSTYGRSEGDRALMLVAGALRKFRDIEHPCFISRYYADEFMLIGNIKDDDELELFIEHIKNYISNAITSTRIKYFIKINIGYAKYESYSRTETLAGLIEEAERSLNENKEQRKFQTIWQGGSTR